MKHRYIFVVGGVLSGVGKGTSVSSIALLLKDKGYKVTAIKIDPYINVDAGTMNPVEHGEVFVTVDGDETDQDIGNYERFLNTEITSINYMTTGRVYQSVIERERNLEYKGKCVSVVPHVPQEAIARIKKAAEHAEADFVIIEIGGTVGEYENILFLEAARMMKLADPEAVQFVLVSYLPVPASIGEMKTKPTQHAVRLLNGTGIQPDFIIARSAYMIDAARKRKLSVHCNMAPEDIIPAPNLDSIYEVPLKFLQDKLSDKILAKFGLKRKNGKLKEWRKMVRTIKNVKREVKIAVVGKYFSTGNFVLSDAYISVIEAIKHAAWYHKYKPTLEWLNSEEYEEDPRKLKELDQYDGILIPGGFGTRGVEGKIAVVEYARENSIPYFGICYGMQMAVVEFARNICGLENANTAEINPSTENPVIHVMEEQAANLAEKKYGGTMRLGSYNCKLKKDTVAGEAYEKRVVSERHRHRYEVNNNYRKPLEENGMVISGTNPERDLVEIIELPNHPFFVGVQFHPEFQSKPLKPHPLFRQFVKASIKRIKKKAQSRFKFNTKRASKKEVLEEFAKAAESSNASLKEKKVTQRSS
ncbi:MAG: CTP synthetase [Parcubacteria group bacterium]|nr:CTP synthetase [Parcubacteria group bacterium]